MVVTAMYESPIKVFQSNLEMQFEGEILKAVQRIGITVDKDELIRALRYDREQYQKGFDDAMKTAVPVVRCEDCIRRYDTDECPMCFLIDGKYYEYTNENGFCDRGDRKEGAE